MDEEGGGKQSLQAKSSAAPDELFTIPSGSLEFSIPVDRTTMQAKSIVPLDNASLLVQVIPCKEIGGEFIEVGPIFQCEVTP